MDMLKKRGMTCGGGGRGWGGAGTGRTFGWGGGWGRWWWWCQAGHSPGSVSQVPLRLDRLQVPKQASKPAGTRLLHVFPSQHRGRVAWPRGRDREGSGKARQGDGRQADAHGRDCSRGGRQLASDTTPLRPLLSGAGWGAAGKQAAHQQLIHSFLTFNFKQRAGGAPMGAISSDSCRVMGPTNFWTMGRNSRLEGSM